MMFSHESGNFLYGPDYYWHIYSIYVSTALFWGKFLLILYFIQNKKVLKLEKLNFLRFRHGPDVTKKSRWWSPFHNIYFIVIHCETRKRKSFNKIYNSHVIRWSRCFRQVYELFMTRFTGFVHVDTILQEKKYPGKFNLYPSSKIMFLLARINEKRGLDIFL